jgi:YVTN family beta-propeller protein
MPTKFFNLILMILGSLAFGLPALSTSEDLLLYVGNSKGNEVSVVDLASLKVIRHLGGVGQDVHCIALTPDGHRLFTTSETDHTLNITDTATDKVIGTVKLPGKPNQCAVTPDGHYVTVPIRDGDSVAIIDVKQQKIVKVLPIKEPHNSVNMGSNRYTFVSSMGSHEIDVIDFEKMDYSDHIPVGGRPRPFVISKDGRTMYVAVSYLHGFNIVDIPEKKVVERVEMPSQHPGPPRPREYETPDTYTHGLALSPDESELWVSSLLDDSVYVYDIKRKTFTGPFAAGDGPNWIVFSPDGKLVAVSNTDSDDVCIYSVKDRRELTRVRVGKAPKRISIATAPAASPAQAPGQSTSN